MRKFSFGPALAFALVAAPVDAQCPPASTYVGFHRERVGSAIASDGDEALFGHLDGWNCGFFARRPNDSWWRTALMGGSGAGPGNMGFTVGFKGDVAALGDAWDYSLPGFSSGNPNGAAVVYERSGGTWTRISDLYPPVPATGTRFGWHVAVADDASRVIVGATIFGGQGEVHIYERDATGWVLEQTIAGANLSTPSGIGGQTALTNGHLLLGTFDGAGVATVAVFTQQAGVWTEIGTLAPPQLVLNSGFGGCITVDGNRIVIAAAAQPSGTETGVLFEYDMSLANWMTQPTVITPPAGSTVTRFGFDLELEGDRLAIGAIDRAFEYRRTGGTWQLFADLLPPTEGFSYDFGEAVGLYSSGILVGDSSYDPDPWQYPDGPGGVHAYDLTDQGQNLKGCGRAVALEYGGTLQFEINWPQYAIQNYQVFGSVTGTGPISVGGIQIPLTPDAYTELLPGSQLFSWGAGWLDGDGHASMWWNVPRNLPLTLHGLEFHHAVVMYNPFSGLLAASNAVKSTLIKLF